MLGRVKTALRVTSDVYDAEIKELISAAYADLELVGVDRFTRADQRLINMAVVTYCRANFSSPPDYDKLKSAYDEMKAQLITSSYGGL